MERETPAARWAWLAPVLLAFPIFVVCGLWSHHLWYPDEPRVAGIASELLRGGSPWVPTLHGQPFLDKPPLAFWSVAAALSLFGPTDAAARLSSIAFGALGAVFVGLLAQRLYRSKLAGATALVLTLFTTEYFWVSHRVLVDAPLGASTIAAVYFLLRAVHEPTRTRWFLAAGCAATVGFYCKGLLGFGFPAFALLGILAYRREWAFLKNPRLLLAAGCSALLILPWICALVAELGAAGPYRVFVENHLYRFLPFVGGSDYHGGHIRPWHYYLARLPAALLPLTALLPAAVVWHWRQPEREGKEALALCAGWLGLGLLLLTAAGTKRTVYLFPLLPACAVVVGGWLAAAVEQRGSKLGTLTLHLAALALVLGSLGSGFAFWIGTGTPPAAWTFPALLVALPASILAARALRARRGARFLFFAGVALPLVFVANVDNWLRWGDRDRDLSPFYLELRHQVPPSARLIAVASHYSSQGSLAFYTQRRCELIHDVDEARQLAASSEAPVYLVFVERSRRGRWHEPGLAGLLTPQTQVLHQLERGRFRASLVGNAAARGPPAP